jgi:hexosaminidase
MLFPRIIALAERAWRRPEWEPAYRAGASYSFGDGKVNQAQLRSEWQSFATRVRAQLPQLERAGVAYRIAPPGARIVDGRLEANTEFPGQRVEFRPRRAAWTVYSGPVRVRGPVELRTRSADGRRVSRTVEVAP